MHLEGILRKCIDRVCQEGVVPGSSRGDRGGDKDSEGCKCVWVWVCFCTDVWANNASMSYMGEP